MPHARFPIALVLALPLAVSAGAQTYRPQNAPPVPQIRTAPPVAKPTAPSADSGWSCKAKAGMFALQRKLEPVSLGAGWREVTRPEIMITFGPEIGSRASGIVFAKFAGTDPVRQAAPPSLIWQAQLDGQAMNPTLSGRVWLNEIPAGQHARWLRDPGNTPIRIEISDHPLRPARFGAFYLPEAEFAKRAVIGVYTLPKAGFAEAWARAEAAMATRTSPNFAPC